MGDTLDMSSTLTTPSADAARPYPAIPAPGFDRTGYEHVWTIDRPRSAVWAWLCDPATFVDGQIPPYRVEFLTNDAGETGFAEGVYNSHVGPFMNFSGILGTIQHERYRDLHYFYGSYAVSHALFRPTRLQFWVEDGATPGTTVMRLQVDADVRKKAQKLWIGAMRTFWKRFGSWCESAVSESATPRSVTTGSDPNVTDA